MFSGLSVKSSDGGINSSAAIVSSNEAPATGSSFSFLCNPPINEDRSIPSPINSQEEEDYKAPSPGAPGSSGFNFISSTVTSLPPQRQEVPLDPSIAPISSSTTKTPAASSSGISGFSFLSNSTTTAQNLKEEETTSGPAPSAFAFLNSSIGINPSLQQQQIPNEYNVKEEESTAPSSAFSFLSQPTSGLRPTNSLNPDVNIHSLPPLHVTPTYTQPKLTAVVPNTSILPTVSVDNKHLPTSSTIAAGVVFEGASKPGAIQKKRRGKKIGVGAHDQQDSITTTTEPSNVTSSINQHNHPSMKGQEEAENLRTAAAIAAERAEQFILQKQREIGNNTAINSSSSLPDSSSAVHMGRYGVAKESKNDAVADATVEAAERAAKEAQQLMVNGNNSGPSNGYTKSGIMSGFFGRTTKKFGFLGNSSTHGKGNAPSNDVNHSGGSPQRLNSTDSNIYTQPSNSEPIHDPTDPSAAAPHYTTPTRNGSLSFVIPAPTISLSIASGNTNFAHDGKKDESVDQATMQQRLEEERRAHFKEQERLWQAAQREREESERLAREKEEARLRKLAEEERKKNRSPQEKIDELLAQFALDAQQSMKQVLELRNQKTIIEKEKANTEKQLRSLSQQQTLTERQQSAAAEAEDFDLADRFAAVLEKLSNDYNEQESTLNGIQRALSHLETQQSEHVERLIGCFHQVKSNLKLLRDEQEYERKEGSNEIQLKFVTTAKKISSETERLAIEKEHLERDEEVVSKERRELEGLIHSETAEEESLRLSAISKLETVNEEIEALKLKLAEKEAEAVNLSLSIASHEASITKVRSKFSRQQGRVSKKELALKENRNEWEADTKALTLLKEGHEKEVQLHSEKLLKYEQFMDVIKSELVCVENMETIISDHLSALNDTVLTESLSDVWEHQAEVVECQVSVDEAKEELRAALAGLEALREEVSQLEKRIPLLEQQKNAAVSARDFKAAGKASKDIKEAIARKEQCEHEINGEVTYRITSLTKSLEKFTSDLKAKEEEVRQKEHQQAQFSMAKLANKISELKLIKEQAENAKGGIASVVAAVLMEEINTLFKEGEALGEKYGGWSDFLAILNKKCEEEKNFPGVSIMQEDEDANSIVSKGSSSREKYSGDDMSTPKKPPTTKEMIEKWKSLTERIKSLEESLENAVAVEDYEAAANIDDELQLIKSEKENMGLTEDHIDMAIQYLTSQPGDDSDAYVENLADTEGPAITISQSTEEGELNVYSNIGGDENGAADVEEKKEAHGDSSVGITQFEDDEAIEDDHSDDDEHDSEEIGCLI